MWTCVTLYKVRAERERVVDGSPGSARVDWAASSRAVGTARVAADAACVREQVRSVAAAAAAAAAAVCPVCVTEHAHNARVSLANLQQRTSCSIIYIKHRR